MDQNLPCRKFQPEKRLSKVLGDLFRVKIRLKWAIIPFFRCSKILGQAGKQENFRTNPPKILDLKSSSEQIFSENCRWVPPENICQVFTRLSLACRRNGGHFGEQNNSENVFWEFGPILMQNARDIFRLFCIPTGQH